MLDMLSKIAKNNYIKTSSFDIFGQGRWFKNANKIYNDLMSPKVETVGPKLLEEFFMGDVIKKAI